MLLKKAKSPCSALVRERWLWQPRMFILLPSCIQYFKRNEPRARGLLSLQRIDDISQVRYGTKLFCLKADSYEDAAGWVRDIINNKYLPLVPGIAVINDSDHDKPWRIRSNRDLGAPINVVAGSIPQSCQSGDILLFRTAGVRGNLVRNATMGAYDHVGMILKLKSGKIGVLEALGNTGVHVVNFDAFLSENWHEQYSQVCIRHLESPVSQISSRALSAFCRRVIGRRYSWKPAAHVLRHHQPDDIEPDAYFCSELLASAYKAMGYLRPDLPASRYTPAMFSYCYNLQLLDNRLSPEIRLNFPS